MNTPVRLVLALVAGLLTSCKDGSGPAPSVDAAEPLTGDSGAPMSRAAVVSALATCTLEVYRAFAPAAERLAQAAADLAADGSPDRWTAAREAWATAMQRWQEVEVFQYGPLAPRQASPGAQDIRDNIYAFPYNAPCFVEQEIVAQRYNEPNFATTGLINVRGLAAAEYLLFFTGTENHCAPTVAINSAGSWAALSADELAQRKRRYAAVVTADIARRARDLVDAWDPGKGNFLGEVSTAGAGSKVYGSSQIALNAMSHALFYIENPGKDVKLARPLGVRDCDAPPCLDQLESRFAARSKSHLASNLDGFEKLAFGCPAGQDLGFDDLLLAAGAGDLATRMKARVPPIRAALAAIPGDDFREALTADLAQVQAVYDQLRLLIVLLKTEFVSTLNLELPRGIQSDQD
jgi:predicted lipoprotein